MDIVDIITIIIASYGAVLSTLLGIREWNKNTRKIKIILEHVVWAERLQITVVNIGYRPITITGISMAVKSDAGDFYEPIPSGELLEYDPFPQTLEDGKSMVIRFAKFTPEMKYSPKITIFDAENKQYSDYEMQEINDKWDVVRKEKRVGGLG